VVLVSTIASILYAALLIYLITMWARFIVDIVQVINRQWRPRGFLLVVTEVAYMLTDPPLRLVRRLVPPIRTGGMALDFAWSIVMLVVIVLIILVGSLR
jgi:YggT family protein